MKRDNVRRFFAVGLFGVVAFLLVGFTLAADKPVTPEMLLNLKSVSQPSLDPSCQQVAYVLHVPRSDEDEPGGRYSEIWVAALHDTAPRKFTSKPVNSWAPQWSPGGESISFLSKRTGHDESTQVYLIPGDGGEAQILTHHETDIHSYRWSPDGRWIAFAATDPKSDEQKENEKKGRDWLVMHEGNRYTRLWLYDLKSGDSRKIYDNDLNLLDYRWGPDNRTIIFQATEKPGADPSLMFRKIYRVSIRGGRPRVICETEGKLGDMAVSLNGEYLAFLGASNLNDPLPQSVFIVPLKGGEAENVTEGFEESAFGVHWVDNETLLLLTNKGTQTTLSTLNVFNGQREHLVKSEHIIYDLDWSQDAEIFALTASTPEHPADLFWGSLDTADIIRLTHHHPEVESIDLAKQEVIAWMVSDGLWIEGVLTYPLDYRKSRRYPLVLLIHGGPEGVSRNGWTTSALSPVQLLAAEGYMVLQPNYRGSGGRGVTFSKGDHDDLGGKEFEDVLSGIDFLVEQGLVDPDRVGIAGWSYGGYFSAWGATRYSHRFNAALVAAGISNWISFTGTTDIPYEMSLVHWNSWWLDVPELHWERSPLYYIDDANTPTLVIHGARDERVDPEQGMELYQALRIKGVPTQLVLYPREPHGLGERAHRLDYMQRLLSWFDQYVKR